MKMSFKKIAVIALAMILMCGACIGGTYAWLMAKTDPLKNTFTLGNVSITLTETTGDTYKMIPGTTIAKDPVVTVEGNSEPCYVFVHVTEANNVIVVDGEEKKILNYTMSEGWAQVPGNDHVYFRVHATLSESDVSYHVLADDQVSISDKVESVTNSVTLTFQAYAIQSAGIAADGQKTAVEVAWETVHAAYNTQQG